jgi:hypothetical protein
MVKLRKMRCAGQVAHMGEMRKEYKILIENAEGIFVHKI